MYIGRNYFLDKVNFCKIYFLIDGCVIVFFFCLNKFKVFEFLKDFGDFKWLSIFEFKDGLVLNIFECIKDIVGLFIEDREFIVLIEKELYIDEDGYWCLLLLFCFLWKCLLNNRSMVV